MYQSIISSHCAVYELFFLKINETLLIFDDERECSRIHLNAARSSLVGLASNKLCTSIHRNIVTYYSIIFYVFESNSAREYLIFYFFLLRFSSLPCSSLPKERRACAARMCHGEGRCKNQRDEAIGCVVYTSPPTGRKFRANIIMLVNVAGYDRWK